VRFKLYTDKTVNQCLNALNDRMQAKGTASRPAMDGWMDKSGKFSISISSKVLRRFERTTRLRGEMKRESGVTIIEGFVPSGVDNRGQLIIMGALILTGILLAVRGTFVLGLATVFLGAGLYVMLVGDQQNSEQLIKELRRVLGAKDKPPKK